MSLRSTPQYGRQQQCQDKDVDLTLLFRHKRSIWQKAPTKNAGIECQINSHHLLKPVVIAAHNPGSEIGLTTYSDVPSISAPFNLPNGYNTQRLTVR